MSRQLANMQHGALRPHNAKDWTGVVIGEFTAVRASRFGRGYWVLRCANGHEKIAEARSAFASAQRGAPYRCQQCAGKP